MKRLALLMLLAVAACGKPPKAEEEPKPVAQVKTALLESAVLPETVTAYGSTEFAPGAERTLASPGEAVVRQVLTTPGTVVSAGQAVALLGPSIQSQIDLKKATQDALTANEAYARARRLRASGLVSDADVETARAAVANGAATITGLRARAAGVIRSPIDGVVETLTAAPGDLLAAGASLGKVGSTRAMRIRLGVEPQVASQLRPGARILLSPASGGATLPSVLLSIDPRADAQTRLAGAIAQSPSGAAFAPGQPIRGEIVLRQASGVVAPRTAVYYEADQPYLMVVTGGVAHRKEVKLGAKTDEQVQVTEGVSPGERIVVEGGASLEDGARVREAAAPKSDGKEEGGAK